MTGQATGMDRTTGRAIAGADHLRQSIADILGTPVGSRVGRRDYGSHLPRLLGQPMNEGGRLRLVAAAALALLRHESRAAVSRITLVPGAVAHAAILRIEGTRTDALSRPFAFEIPVSTALPTS